MPTTWTIAPGDHLWHVATATLRTAWQRTPSNGEIAGYLDRLIDANRDRLAIRDDPDLVFPGQTFTLPAPPPAPDPIR
jgi:nucleoid-associated protein YgaU